MYRSFTSPIGVFVILRDGERYDLYLGDECLGSYTSEAAAAEDARAKAGKDPNVDGRHIEHIPVDIDKWEIVKR